MIVPPADADLYTAALAAKHSACVLTQLIPHWHRADHVRAARVWLARASDANTERLAARSRQVDDYREVYGEPPPSDVLDRLVAESDARCRLQASRAMLLARLHWRAAGQHRPLIRRPATI